MDEPNEQSTTTEQKNDADFDSTWKIGDETWNLRTIRGGDEPNAN